MKRNSTSAGVRLGAALVMALLWTTCLSGVSDASPEPNDPSGSADSPAKVTTGTLDTLFVPVYGSDQSAGSESMTSMQSAMATVDQYYNSVSRGTTRVNATVMNWLPIDDDLNDDCGHIDLSTHIAAAAVAAQQAGQNPNSYDRLILFAHQSPTCAWGGGAGFVNHLVPGTTATMPIVINGLETLTMIHELGHTLGLKHVHDWNCDTVYTGNCQSGEYGGRFDPMGSTWPDALSFSAPSLARLGVLPAADVATVDTNGVFHLAPLATAQPGQKRVLRIPPTAVGGSTYMLEYRTPGGLDAPMATPAFADWRPGVILHELRGGGAAPDIYQYDGTPGSQPNDLADGGLPVNAAVTAPDGLTITVTSQGPAGATVRVEGFLSTTSPPTIRSIGWTTVDNPANAMVRVRWSTTRVASDVVGVRVESFPQFGQPVVAGNHPYADLPMPPTPGCVVYRIRALGPNGSLGVPSAWSSQRCFFDEIQPGSMVVRAHLRPFATVGIGTTGIETDVDPTWSQTNHYLWGAFIGYHYELAVQGQPLHTGTTTGTVRTSLDQWINPVPINTTRNASLTLTPRPGDDATTEIQIPFNASLQVPVTTIPDGWTPHLASIPASPHMPTTLVRALGPAEVTTTGCASAGPADVQLLPGNVSTPFPYQNSSTVAATYPSSQGPQFASIRVLGNSAPQPDRCLLWMDQDWVHPFNVRLIRITDDDSIAPPPPGGSNG